MKINYKEGGIKTQKKASAPPPPSLFCLFSILSSLEGKVEIFQKRRESGTSTVFNAMSVVINIYVVIEERVLNLCILGIKSIFKGFFFLTWIKIPRHTVEVMDDFIFQIFSIYNVYFCRWYIDIYFQNKKSIWKIQMIGENIIGLG